jgi:Zn finger protein HypA/HybF involved in hydrogenase expression
MMSKRQIEIFTADCPLCNETVKLVQELACPSCEVSVYDLRKGQAQPIYLEKAQQYGVNYLHQVGVPTMV